jgi:hypothetical protein
MKESMESIMIRYANHEPLLQTTSRDLLPDCHKPIKSTPGSPSNPTNNRNLITRCMNGAWMLTANILQAGMQQLVRYEQQFDMQDCVGMDK